MSSLVQVSPSVQQLIETLRIQTVSGKDSRMSKFIWDQVLTITPTPTIATENGNFYITKGKADRYPCIVAHLDTVHEILPEPQFKVYIDRGHLFGWNEVMKRWEGIGGDDKVGIWIALEALRTFDTIKVALFRDEEWGCQGSAKANLGFFEDTTLVLQADRKGHNDFVRKAAGTKLHGDEFAEAVKPILAKHGYQSIDHGGMTDVMKLRDIGLEVASANISCGYYEPHSYREYVDIADAENARDLILNIVHSLGGQRWEWLKPRVLKVNVWPAVPPRYRDARYRDAISTGICPGCQHQDCIIWDDDEREWFCADCQLWLPDILTKLGAATITHTAWSPEARSSLYLCYEMAILQSMGCVACGAPEALVWSQDADDIFCVKCGKSLEEVVRFAVEKTIFETPRVIVEPPKEEGA